METGVTIVIPRPTRRHNRRRTKHSDAFSGGARPGGAFFTSCLVHDYAPGLPAGGPSIAPQAPETSRRRISSQGVLMGTMLRPRAAAEGTMECGPLQSMHNHASPAWRIMAFPWPISATPRIESRQLSINNGLHQASPIAIHAGTSHAVQGVVLPHLGTFSHTRPRREFHDSFSLVVLCGPRFRGWKMTAQGVQP